MLKGFKEFLMKGNVVDLAVAVVIGAAFTAIVKAFTDSIINPLIARIGGKGEIGLGFQLGDANDPTTFVNIGAVITAAINFVIIAAVVYFVIVMPYEKLKSIRAAHGEEDLTEQELLTEIRDLLSGKDPKAAKALDQATAAGAIAGPGFDAAADSAAGAAAQPVTQHFSAAGATASEPFNAPEPYSSPEPFKASEPFSVSEPYKAPDAFGNPEPYSSPEPFKAPEPFGSTEAYSATPGGATPEPPRPSEPFSGRSDAFGAPAGSGFSSPAERFEPPRPSGPPSGAFPAQPPSGAFPAQRPPSGAFPAQPPSGPTVVPPTGAPHTPPPPPAPQPGGWNPPPPAGPAQNAPGQNAPGQGAPNPGNADPFGTTRMSGTDPGAVARDQFGRPIDDRFNGPQGGNGGQHGRHQQ